MIVVSQEELMPFDGVIDTQDLAVVVIEPAHG